MWIGFVGYQPARVDHRFKDGDAIRVGPIALTRTSRAATRAAAHRGRSPLATVTA